MGEVEFSNAAHIMDIREESCDAQNIRDDVNNSKLKELVTDLDSTDLFLILCAFKQRFLAECTG